MSRMNPEEAGETSTNGQTRQVQQPATSQAVRARPKKAPELPALERRNWLIHLHYVRKEYQVLNSKIN